MVDSLHLFVQLVNPLSSSRHRGFTFSQLVKLFVGTLKTIENEFEECIASIERQSHQNFEHFVFEDLPNKEAHDTLYRSFMDRSDEFDLLVKVDADMARIHRRRLR